ncbi:hypothetical protein F5883DRAFT_10041 [Diaporthe sp. PMI_573]|nr:hypothetical protein F5883DRAFT_10041 [Diaporthaceae sp. PMI_573]
MLLHLMSLLLPDLLPVYLRHKLKTGLSQEPSQRLVYHVNIATMVYNPIDIFGITCPAGGAFFVCENCDIQFLGCCASDPGEDGSGVSNSHSPLHPP